MGIRGMPYSLLALVSEVRGRVSIRANESRWKSHLKITVASLQYLRWRELQSRSSYIRDHCSLTIKEKNVFSRALCGEVKWERGLHVWNCFQYAVYFRTVLERVCRKFNSPSLILSLHLPFRLFSTRRSAPLCHFVPFARPFPASRGKRRLIRTLSPAE